VLREEAVAESGKRRHPTEPLFSALLSSLWKYRCDKLFIFQGSRGGDFAVF
jgi:hypothetical protein